MKSLRMMPSFRSEFNKFLDDSIRNFSSIGYNPLLSFFLSKRNAQVDMHSSNAKKFLDRLLPNEKEEFKKIISVYQKQNEREKYSLLS